MRFTEEQVIGTVERVSVSRLRSWVERGCVRPTRDLPAGDALYSEADLARVSLLCELEDEWELAEDALPVVVSLIDQIHGLRYELRQLARAIETQPGPVQDRIKRAFRDLSED